MNFKKFKKFLAAFLALMMIFSLVCNVSASSVEKATNTADDDESVAVFKVAFGTLEFGPANTLSEAIECNETLSFLVSFNYPGETPVVTLNEDYTVTEDFLANGEYPFVLDLNGNTLTVAEDATLSVDSGFEIIGTGSVVGDVKVTDNENASLKVADTVTTDKLDVVNSEGNTLLKGDDGLYDEVETIPAVVLNAQTVLGTIKIDTVNGDNLSYVLGRLDVAGNLYPLAGGISIVNIDINSDVEETEVVNIKYNTVIKGNGSVSGTVVVADGAVLTVNDTVGIDNLNVVDARGNAIQNVNGVYTPVEANYVAKVDGVKYESLQAAINAAQSGDTIVLLDDVVISDTIVIEKSITIDGQGHKLIAIDGKTYNSAIMAGNSGWGDNHGETIKLVNLEVSGFATNYGAIRAQGVTLKMNGCVVNENSVSNYAYAVISLNYTNATITNCTFENNKDKVIDVNYNGDYSEATVTIDGCTFDANKTTGAGIVMRSDGYLVVKNSTFTNNIVNTDGNGATLYVGFGTGNEVIGCTFEGNSVTTSYATTKRIAGAIFCDGCVVRANVFGDNTAVRNGESVSTVVAVGAYYGDADISGNYWGGNAPVQGVDYTIEFSKNVKVDNYYKDADCTELVNITYVAKIGNYSYTSFADAYVAAKADDTIVLLAPIVVNKGETLTLNKGVTIAYTSNVAGEDMITNRGTLIVDGDTIVYVNTDSTGSNVTVSTISAEPGSTTIIKSGVVKNETVKADGSSIYSYAIDLLTNGSLGDVTVTISGGTVYSDYMAIRQFNNGTACKNTLNVTGGYIYGAKRAVQVHLDNNAAYTNISGGKIEGGSYSLCFLTTSENISVSGGEFIGSVWYSGDSGFISGGKFDSDVTEYCAEGFFANDNGDGTYGVIEYCLAGSGTEEDPYIINNVKDLIFFRDSVNSGDTKYNAPGVWVALGADIDLEGATWTEGIGDGHNWSFDGNFDGKNHTIKNLTITPYADSNKYLCGGLFGYIYGNVNIKNLVLENIIVSTETAGHNVGILAGFANNNGGKANISNITVKNSTVYAPNAYGVGSIVGYSYRNMGVIDNCTVEDVTINGYSFVGGITGYSFTGAVISNCTVKNSTITATNYSVGGIAGIVCEINKISGCTVENVTVSGEANVGNVVGAISGNGSTLYIENCVASAPFVGGNYADNKTVVAKVGNKYYSDLQAAIDSANGETVTLLVPITVNKGEELVIDLKGQTVSTIISTQLTKSFAMIQNKGTLTITDSVGGGKLSLDYTADSFGYGVGLYTISNEGGTLVIEGGRVENLATVSGSMYDAIDNNSTLGDTYLTINGGEIYCGYLGIRQFANSTTYENVVTVNDGKVEGGNSSIWIQNPGSKQPKADVVVNDGDIIGRILAGESTEFAVAVSGGTFSVAVPEEFCAEGFIPVANADGTYGVKIGEFVAEVGGVKYESLSDAFAVAQSGDTVKLLANIREMYIIVNPGVTLDLNGYYLSVSSVVASYGDIIDTAETTGGIKCSSDMIVHLQTDNIQLPLYDSESGCYRFYEYELELIPKATAGVADSVRIGYRLKFTNREGYKLLAQGGTGITAVIYLDWEGKAQPLAVTIDENSLKAYGNTAYKQAENGGEIKTAIALTVKNLNKISGKTLVINATATSRAAAVAKNSQAATYDVP